MVKKSLLKKDPLYERRRKNKNWYRSRGLKNMESRFGKDKITKEIKKRLTGKKKVRVLEIGFGEGKFLLNLLNKFPKLELYGVNDRKRKSMKKRKHFYKNAKIFKIEVDKTNLPRPYFFDANPSLKFKDNFFDIIVSQVAIHYFKDKQNYLKKSGGYLKKEEKHFYILMDN